MVESFYYKWVMKQNKQLLSSNPNMMAKYILKSNTLILLFYNL